MSKQEIKMLVPKLRFPEFQGAGEWDEMKLGDALNGESSQIAKNKLNIVEKGFPIYGADGFIGNIKSFSQNNDYIAVVKDGSGVGNLFLYKNKSSLLGTLTYLLSKDKTKYNLVCLYYLMQTIDFKPFVKGSGIPHIYYKDYSVLKIYLPQPEEQQKIADCLSSIDELITVHTQKHEALKTHKKGLMQQLFPAEGETVPKLRFPEFQDDTEWGGYLINELVRENILYAPKDGNHGNIHPKSSDYVDMGIPFIMANDFKNGEIDYLKCSHLSKHQADNLQKGFAKEGDVLLTHKGTVGEVTLIKMIDFPYLMLTPQVTYYRVRDKRKLSNEFLATLFTSEYFQGILKIAAGGGTRAYIGITEQGKLKITVPANILEQQKIAECFISINELIKTQVKKIESLKAHKKGLMQQLFPATNEVNG